MPKEKLVVILGPTATGKSYCGLALAKRLGGEIISGDSMLVYQRMNIGTAKPSAEELAQVPHHLVNILPPEAEFSVVDFKERAALLIKEINGRGKIPLLVGGTGLYIKALLEDYRFSQVGENTCLRQCLNSLAEKKGNQVLYTYLQRFVPAAAARISINDRKRLVRAIEAYRGGECVSEAAAGEPVYAASVFGLTMERSALYARINQRVDQMLEAGLEQETRQLLRDGLKPDALSLRSIGYRQMVAYCRGQCPYPEMVAQIKQATRNFAKRQITWYKKMPYVTWLELEKEPNYEKCVDKMYSLLVETGNLL